MIEILDRSTGSTIGIKISDEIEAEDYENLLPRFDQAISEHGEINLLVLIDDFEGLDDLDAAKADYEFGTNEYRQVRRAAFVSDKNWHKWAIKLLDPFTRRTDEKFFEPDALDEAWEWVKK